MAMERLSTVLLDQQIIGWAAQADMPIHRLLTKADKLSAGPAKQTLMQVRGRLAHLERLFSVQLFSALRRQELVAMLDRWLTDDNGGPA